MGIENNKVEHSETKSEPTTIECEKDNKNRGGDGETLPLFVRPSVLPLPLRAYELRQKGKLVILSKVCPPDFATEGT